jgi:hypothetical protein
MNNEALEYTAEAKIDADIELEEIALENGFTSVEDMLKQEAIAWDDYIDYQNA